MFKNLFPGLGSGAKLLRAIRNDHYKNWETHFEDYSRNNGKKVNPVKRQKLGLEIYEHHLKEMIDDYAISGEEKEALRKIRDYFQLPDDALDSIKSRYAKAAVTHLSKQKMGDNQLTEAEIQEIGLFAKELNISEEEVKRINQKNVAELYENAVKQMVADKMVTVEEQEALKRIAQQLGIDIREVTIDKKLRDDYYYLVLLNALDQGYLPKCKPPSIVTKDDEVAHWEISSNLVFTRTFSAGYISEDSPLRIRVAKGVSYRLGANKSRPIREQVGANHPGVFVVTNKGVVFAGHQQSFSIPFTQLDSFETYTDGIGLQKDNTELLLQFYDQQMSEVVFKVLTNAINANT